MSRREKLLGVLVGVLLVLVFVALTYRWVRGTLDGRRQREAGPAEGHHPETADAAIRTAGGGSDAGV